ncbi:hypothetical protein MLD38_005514 [Melastoma candidum]|uniref:Uncharacterized protein n=1 Tax=Melastoma candidum TaxID=119954 RepID=A0ACB9RL64_9MYRT|nr:hypothetical protein MLD38_005514 [Melastoma candidum]
MEDVLTEIPPPSRFFQEDLSNFVVPSPSIPSPFLLFSNPKPNLPLRPSLLIIALSSPSICLFHSASGKTLIGSLIIPEIPYSGLSAEPSLNDKTCNIFSLGDDQENNILLVTVQCAVTVERCYVVAKRLIGEAIIPQKVVIFSSIPSALFRGKLSPDENYVFKLETSQERATTSGNGYGDESLLKGLDYFPSGSVVDGLAAALLSRCEIRGLKGTLCVSWPEFSGSIVPVLKSIVENNLLPKYKFSFVHGDISSELYPFSRMKNKQFESELYS